MKKAIFLNTEGHKRIDRVYSKDVLAKLGNMLEICDTVISKENFSKYVEVMKEVEFAFSTWGMPEFTEDEIKIYMPNLKAVFYAAGSVQSFARPFLKNNIQVISAWAANGIPVAEYSVSQIILANKGFYQSSLMMKTRPHEAKTFFDSFPGNYDIKIGLLGLGQIGSKVVELLKPYNLEILVFDPFLSDKRAIELGVKKTDLGEIFSTCQTISNHLANLPATFGILGKAHFSNMLENATFINTGRGAQVVEKELADALKEVPTRTAVLDVTVMEPLEPESPLKGLDNVFLTPHIAGSSGKELVRMAQYMVDEFVRFEKGDPLRYSVTLEMLQTMA